MPNNKTLTVWQVAEELQVSRESVYEYLQSGKLKGYKIAGWLWRVKRDDLDKFIEEHSNVKADKS
jgi:excisionase family DNA binding protein